MKTFLSLLLFLPLLTQGQKVETSIQYGHHLPVYSVKYSPDGKILASGSRDKSIRLWETSTGRELRTLSYHEATVRSLDFSPDGKLLVSGGNDAKVLVWEVATGKLLHNLKGHDDRVTSVKVSPSGKYLLTGGYDNEAILWNLDSATIIKRLKVDATRGTGEGIDASFSPDGKLMAIGQDNYATVLWDVEKRSIIDTLRYDDGGWCGGCANWSAFSEDSKTLYTASNKKGIFKWNVKTGKLIKKNTSEARYVGLLGSPVEDRLITVGEKEITVYDDNLNALKTISSGETQFNGIDIHNNTIAVGTDDNTVQLFDLSGNKKGTFKGLIQDKTDDGLDYDINSMWDHYIIQYILTKPCIALSPDGNFMLIGKIGKKARLIEFKTGRVVHEFEGHKKTVLSAAFSPDGKYLLTGGGDAKIILWNLATGDSMQTFRGHRDAIFDLAFNTSGNQFISSSWDGSIRSWNIETGEQVKRYNFDNASPFKSAYVLNDLYILTSMLDGTIRLLEPDTGEEVIRYKGHADKTHDFTVHQDGMNFITASWDGLIKEFDLVNGLQVRRLSSGPQKKYATAYSHDERLIATGGEDRIVTLWNKKDNTIIQTLEGHKSAVNSITITKDDKYLISGSVDGELKVWDLQKQKELFAYYVIGSKDWLVKTPEGLFDATKQAQQYIFFIQGTKSYSIDQFFDDFYQPDLIRQVFANKDTRLKDYNITERLKDFPPPSIEVITPEPGKQLGLGDTELWIKVHDEGGGIDEVKVLHNGKRIPNKSEKGLHRTPHKGNVTNQTFNLTLVPGVNTIQITAFSDGRVESQPTTLNFPIESEVKKGKCYVLAVGINKYQNPSLNLNYAMDDAQSVVKMVKQHSGALFEDVVIHELYNENATKEKVLNSLDQIALEAKPEDVFLFFYAGHGSLLDRDFYFIPTEVTRLYEQGVLKQTALSAFQVQEIFSHIKALKQVVVIDACHSGASTEVLAQRGGMEEKAIAQLSRSAGVHVMASAGSEQFATEFKELGHGVFTYSLLKALEGDADGAPRDGRVTIFEMKSYLDSVVPDLSESKKGKAQYPYTFSIGNDFPLTVPKP